MAIDSSGNLYIADKYDNVIRRISTGGIISTVAGTGQLRYNGDNVQATKANLGVPRVTVDTSGNFYIADSANERIRRVDINGIITTIAGTGQAGFSGDGFAATAATFSTPAAVALDTSGNVYVADLDNKRIRRVVPGGTVATFAVHRRHPGESGPQGYFVGHYYHCGRNWSDRQSRR
jgi:sugar lactone lactonase YvrE